MNKDLQHKYCSGRRACGERPVGMASQARMPARVGTKTDFPKNQGLATQRVQGQGDVRRAPGRQGVAGANSGPTLKGHNAIGGLEHEEDVADLFGSDDDDVPQGVVAEEGESQQDSFQEAVQGPPEVLQEEFNPPSEDATRVTPRK